MRPRIGYFSAFVLTVSLFPVASLQGGIVAHWKFDESPGSTTAFDSTGIYDGILSGGAAFVAGGVSGNAISLAEASNSLVSMGTSFPGLTSGSFTISAWINNTDTGSSSTVLTKHESGTENGYLIAINDSGAYGQPNKSWFYGSNRAGSEVNSTTTVNDGAWHFVVGVYDASSNTQSIYVDGAPADGTSATQPILANGAPFLIGGYNLAGTATGFYTGLVDDVQVYNMALNDDHISFLFNNPGIAVPEPAAAALLWFATLIGVGRRVRR